ncbi:hypothetical protein [Ferrimonas balearica]|uniref:hypothetical protein n=1 Tax=Ferrimonas balearica TaxID=44012 RepID=UPI001C995433|nr:hypothetical protein [Ferrimonas balearica]MBY5994165.1 hypothetical protein [Ferrimonas balearica]
MRPLRPALLAALLLGGCAGVPLTYHSSGLMAPLPHDGPGLPLCALDVTLSDPDLTADPVHGALEAEMGRQVTRFIQGDGRFTLDPGPNCQGTSVSMAFTDISDTGQFEIYSEGMPMTLTAVAEVTYWRQSQSPATARSFTHSSVMTVQPEIGNSMEGPNLLFINSVRNKTRLMEGVLTELQARLEAP